MNSRRRSALLARPRWKYGDPGRERSWIIRLPVLLVLSAAVATLLGQSDPGPEVVEHVRAGIEARQARRYDEAARELESAAALAPQVAEIHLNLGLVYHEQGDFARAADALQRALELKPDLEGARGLFGFDLLSLGRIPAAIENLEKAYQDEPGPRLSAWLGLAYLKSGRPREAIPKLEAARDSQPDDIDLIFYLAQAHAAVAAQLQATLLQTAPDSARAHHAIAEDHALNGRTHEAIEEYLLVLERAPGMPGIHAALGDLYRESLRYEEAAEHYRQELEQTPGDPLVRYRYGSVLLQLGRSSEALDQLQESVAANPRSAAAQSALGKAYFDEGKLAEAAKAFQAVLGSEATLQQTMSAHYQLGRILRQQEKPQEAAQHMREFRRLRGQLIRNDQQ